ncbi:MAG: hypothetical protein QM727_02535 [Niabella sp.]
MAKSKWIAVIGGAALIAACFMPWFRIDALHTTLTGVYTEGTLFGKPGYAHIAFSIVIIILSLIPKLWAKRANLLFVALNLAWAMRNFIMLGMCEAGECPHKEAGIYIVLISSLILLLTALFPTLSLDDSPKKDL